MTFVFEFPFEIFFCLLCRKFAGNHIVQTQLMSDLLVGIRVSVTLVQKVQGLQSDLGNDSGSPIWQTMCGLLSVFIKILNDGKCDSVRNDGHNCMPVAFSIFVIEMWDFNLWGNNLKYMILMGFFVCLLFVFQMYEFSKGG